jgi:hypothetical protein
MLTSLGMWRGGEVNPDELLDAWVPLLGHQDQLADAALLTPPLQQVSQPEHRHTAVQVQTFYLFILLLLSVLGIRIRMFFGLPDPDPFS